MMFVKYFEYCTVVFRGPYSGDTLYIDNQTPVVVDLLLYLVAWPHSSTGVRLSITGDHDQSLTVHIERGYYILQLLVGKTIGKSSIFKPFWL